MAGINLSGLEATPVNPTVGTAGRTEVTAPDIASSLANLVKSGMQVAEVTKGQGESDDEADGSLKILGSYIKQADPNFDPNNADAAADAAANNIAKDLQAATPDDLRRDLREAAALGRRANDAVASQPSAERRLNIIRAKALYAYIAKHHYAAKEFRSLLYGDNNFITSLIDTQDAQAVAAAKANHEIITKAKDAEYQATRNPAILNMTDAEYATQAQASDYGKSVIRLNQAQQEANYYAALHQKGQAITAEDTARIVEQAKPGLVYTTMGKLEAIAASPQLDEAGKKRAIEDVVLGLRRQITAGDGVNFKGLPWLTATEVDTQFKDILETIPNSYRMLVSSGPEKDQAETQLALIRATTSLDLERRFNISGVEQVSRVFKNLQDAQVFSQTDILRSRDQLKNIEPFKNFVEVFTRVEKGDNPDNTSLTKRTEAQIAKEQTETNQFLFPLLNQFDKLDPTSKKAAAQVIVNSLKSPDNKRTPAGMDTLMALMANPSFKTLGQSDEFKSAVVGEADRAIGNYLAQLDEDVGVTLAPLAGKVSLGKDKEGVLTLVLDPSVDSKMRLAAARLQNRIRNAIHANANLNGQTPEEASIDFYNTYLVK